MLYFNQINIVSNTNGTNHLTDSIKTGSRIDLVYLLDRTTPNFMLTSFVRY